MGDKTGISWTDATWNPIRGCSRVSAGCVNCYAEEQAARIVRMGKGKPTAYDGLVKLVGGDARWTGKVRFVDEHLADPIRWTKPRRIFVNSMSDLFHEKLSNEQIGAVFAVMGAAPQHTFQVLTKRAARMREWFEWFGSTGYAPGHVLSDCLHQVAANADARFDDEEWLVHLINVVNGCSTWKHHDDGHNIDGPTFTPRWPLPNVWLGVSVEDQKAHDERAELLLACPAAVYFFSVEPMLGPIDASQSLRRILRTNDGRLLRNDHPDARSVNGTWRRPVDWVIVGCESGDGARPCETIWIRSIRDQCAAAGVKFFLKQALFDYGGAIQGGIKILTHAVQSGERSRMKPGGVIDLPYLDGVQHAAFPETR